MDTSLQDMVSRFLLGERHLLEKEVAGEPTTGERSPTPSRFVLVDELWAQHRRAPMTEEQFSQALQQAAASARPEQADQASQMLTRWQEFRLLGQPEEQRTSLGASRQGPND